MNAIPTFSLIHYQCMSQTTQVVWVIVVGYGKRNVHLQAPTGVQVQVLPAVKWRVTASVLKGGPLGVQKGR